jgi:predicted PurR-regulated permease PerM
MPLAGRWSPPVRAVLLAAALVAGWLAFRELATFAVLLVVTLVVALPLDAAARRLERLGVPRPLGALVALVLGLAMLAGLLAALVPPLVDELQRFVDAVPAVLREIQAGVQDVTGETDAQAGERVREFLQGYLDRPLRVLGPVASIGLGVVGVAAALIVVLMTAYYIAARPEPLRDGLLSLFPAERRAGVSDTLAEIRAAWAGWLRGVAVDMVTSGLLFYAGLRIIGLEYAGVFATLTALLVVVPYLGAIVSGIPPVLFALSDSPEKALVTLAVFVAVQQVEGNVIVPLVMSRTVHLHPAVIIAGVIVVGRLLGFVGLFVAVPIISAVIILVRRLWVAPLQRAERAPPPPRTRGVAA